MMDSIRFCAAALDLPVDVYHTIYLYASRDLEFYSLWTDHGMRGMQVVGLAIAPHVRMRT